MAGHIQDRWFKTIDGPDGKSRKVKTERHGSGLRYRARYVGPDGTEKYKSFPDRQKRLADQWLAHVEADMARGQYVDPRAARITFGQYTEQWLAAQTTDPTTRTAVGVQLRRHALPYLGSRPLGSFRPEHIREWLSGLEGALSMSSYRRVIFNSVSAVLSAAVDDGHLTKNPCRARTVRPPATSVTRVRPWTAEQVFAVRAALPERYQAVVDIGCGCGLRQGEIFGLAVEAVRFESAWLHVACQVKVVNGHLVFAPPKRGKERNVPLPQHVGHALRRHQETYPPVPVSLPWLRPDGEPVTRLLFFSLPGGGAVRRTDFNTRAWKPALAAAGLISNPVDRGRYESAREHGMHALRHFYASVLLDAGENVKALSSYLGHTDAGFTLRVYTHLMPSSEGRTGKAVDALYKAAMGGPTTADDGCDHARR
ncbi:tyrosine-type recombinase/integrase [Actinacidiphila glaucinigra]|uniref:tyrosine-type recombinase/integrase n=1 Tax=Actinacidiphila glaucinigra TaxID=235986 RepID=UPI003D8D0A9B